MYWRRLETGDWDDKLIWTLFTEVINQARSTVIFSYAYVQPNFFLQPVSTPAGREKQCRFQAFPRRLHVPPLIKHFY